MGQFKQSLIDTDQEDQTDPRDTGYTGEPENDEQDIRELALWDISKAVKVFDTEGLSLTQADELEGYIKQLQERVDTTRKPF